MTSGSFPAPGFALKRRTVLPLPRRGGEGRGEGALRESLVQPPIRRLASGSRKLVWPVERLPRQRIRRAVKFVNLLHVLQETIQVFRLGKNGVLRGIPDEKRPGRSQREHVLPIEWDAGDVRQVKSELRNQRGEVRPALWIRIAAKRRETATRNRRR